MRSTPAAALAIAFAACSFNTQGLMPPPEDVRLDPDTGEVPDVAEADRGPEDADEGAEAEEDAADLDEAEEIDYPDGWFEGYSQRLRFHVGGSGVQETLYNFPLLVALDASQWPQGPVFVELDTWEKRLRLAVTEDDGVSELKVEVETWDAVAGKAWLWVRVPELVPSEDAVFYLYFDAAHADNSASVGDPASVAGAEVWDNWFRGVWHMSSFEGAHPILDSTRNLQNGASRGSMDPATDLVSGMIGPGIDFDGENDYIDVGDVGSDSWTDITVEAWVSVRLPTSETDLDVRVVCKSPGVELDDHIFSLGLRHDGTAGYVRARLGTEYGGSDEVSELDSQAFMSAGSWSYVAFTWSYSTWNLTIYGNGEERGILHEKEGASLINSRQIVAIGNVNATDPRHFDGVIDEVRLSNVARSQAYFTAAQLNATGGLVLFDGIESL
jgi:hypothetical protein